MKNATYILKKYREYDCLCGMKPIRPLQASDRLIGPFPGSCEFCDKDLSRFSFRIVDANLHLQDIIKELEEENE